MQFLLDTQILIYSLEDNPKLKESLRIIIESPDNTMLISPFSLMEMSIKLKLGKLPDLLLV